MRAELIQGLAASHDAYKAARPEIICLPHRTTDPIAAVIVKAAGSAFDLEELIRDFALRMEKGFGPARDWTRKFKDAHRFYNLPNFPAAERRLLVWRPLIHAYLAKVTKLDDTMQALLLASLSE